MELSKKKFVDNIKYNYQAKLAVLYLHQRNTNIIAPEVLVLLYSDCVENSESKFSNPWEQLFVIMCVAWYTYKPPKAELIFCYD
jgi:hypothetical protein